MKGFDLFLCKACVAQVSYEKDSMNTFLKPQGNLEIYKRTLYDRIVLLSNNAYSFIA